MGRSLVNELLLRHEARSSARRIAAEIFEAWDDGDCEAFEGHFAENSVGDIEGRNVEGRDGFRSWFEERHQQEPWTVHWLTNESVSADNEPAAHGTWLWLAASTIRGGAIAAWSGGDLELDVSVNEETGRWLIERLKFQPRFRSPYSSGWLREPLVGVSAPSNAGDGSEGCLKGFAFSLAVPKGPPRESDFVSLDDRVLALRDESELYRLMARYMRGADRELDGTELASLWEPDGSYEVVGLGATAARIQGNAAIAEFHDRERSQTENIIRFLSRGWVRTKGIKGTAAWLDLAVVVRPVTGACWIANRFLADFGCQDGEWKFTNVRRCTLVDCRYQDSWLPTSANRIVMV
jgi:hypothetical protein